MFSLKVYLLRIRNLHMTKTVTIKCGNITVEGILRLPENSQGIIIFAHGSSKDRFNPWNNFVAGILEQSGVASLLLDLLCEKEDLVYENTPNNSNGRFNIELLTQRLIRATQWIRRYPETKHLSIGYFGTSTGTASAFKAAARIGSEIKAVASKGGRPDLAMDEIKKLHSPALIITGENEEATRINKLVYSALRTKKKLKIIPQSSFIEDPGTIHEVAKVTTDWFEKYLF